MIRVGFTTKFLITIWLATLSSVYADPISLTHRLEDTLRNKGLRSAQRLWFDEVELPYMQGASRESFLGNNADQFLLRWAPLVSPLATDDAMGKFDRGLWRAIDEQPLIDLIAYQQGKFGVLYHANGEGYSRSRMREIYPAIVKYLIDQSANATDGEAWQGSGLSFLFVHAIRREFADELATITRDPFLRTLLFGGVDPQISWNKAHNQLSEELKKASDQESKAFLEKELATLDDIQFYITSTPDLYALNELAPNMTPYSRNPINPFRYREPGDKGTAYRALVARAFPNDIDKFPAYVEQSLEDYQILSRMIADMATGRKNIRDLAPEFEKRIVGWHLAPDQGSADERTTAIKEIWPWISKDRWLPSEADGERFIQIHGKRGYTGNLVWRTYAPSRGEGLNTAFLDRPLTPHELIVYPHYVAKNLSDQAARRGGDMVFVPAELVHYDASRVDIAGDKEIMDWLMVVPQTIVALAIFQPEASPLLLKIVQRTLIANLVARGVLKPLVTLLATGHFEPPDLKKLVFSTRNILLMAAIGVGPLSELPVLGQVGKTAAIFATTNATVARLQGASWDRTLLMAAKGFSMPLIGDSSWAQYGVSFLQGVVDNKLRGSTEIPLVAGINNILDNFATDSLYSQVAGLQNAPEQPIGTGNLLSMQRGNVISMRGPTPRYAMTGSGRVLLPSRVEAAPNVALGPRALLQEYPWLAPGESPAVLSSQANPLIAPVPIMSPIIYAPAVEWQKGIEKQAERDARYEEYLRSTSKINTAETWNEFLNLWGLGFLTNQSSAFDDPNFLEASTSSEGNDPSPPADDDKSVDETKKDADKGQDPKRVSHEKLKRRYDLMVKNELIAPSSTSFAAWVEAGSNYQFSESAVRAEAGEDEDEAIVRYIAGLAIDTAAVPGIIEYLLTRYFTYRQTTDSPESFDYWLVTFMENIEKYDAPAPLMAIAQAAQSVSDDAMTPVAILYVGKIGVVLLPEEVEAIYHKLMTAFPREMGPFAIPEAFGLWAESGFSPDYGFQDGLIKRAQEAMTEPFAPLAAAGAVALKFGYTIDLGRLSSLTHETLEILRHLVEGHDVDNEAKLILFRRLFVKVLASNERHEGITNALAQSTQQTRDALFSRIAIMFVPLLDHPTLGDPPGSFFDPDWWDLESITADLEVNEDLRLAAVVNGMLYQEKGINNAGRTDVEVAIVIARIRNRYGR